MSITITCWNVRNMSQWLRRPGIRGRGLDFGSRVRTVGINIKRLKSDVVFLIETGADAVDNLLPILKVELSGTNYNYLVSPATGGETYTLLWKPEMIEIGPHWLVGNIKGYRQGWAVVGKYKGNLLNIIVLHAPASASLDDRRQVLDNIISQSAKVLNVNLPTFLMGDLNFKSTELNTLAGVMANYHFTFVGPFNAANGPELTSLRKYTTLTTGGGIAPGSQPYDQFWGCNFGRATFKTSVEKIIPGLMNEKTMFGNIMYSLEYLSGNYGEPGRQTRQKAAIQANDEILLKTGQFLLLKQRLESPQAVKTMKGLAFYEFLPIIKYNLAFYNYITATLNNLNPALLPAGINWQNVLHNNAPPPAGGPVLVSVPTNLYTAYLINMTDYIFYLDMAVGLFKIVSESGSIGVDIIENIVLEYAISDHFPITMTINIH